MDDGRYLYLHYRSSIGTVQAQPGPDPDSWIDAEPIVEFGEPGLDASISLTESSRAARFGLAEGVHRADAAGRSRVLHCSSPTAGCSVSTGWRASRRAGAGDG